VTTSAGESRARSLRLLTGTEGSGDDVLAYVDQAMFLGLRATGQAAVMQSIWVYEHPLDLDGLRRFHYNFGHGLWGRLIEPSVLPFGRHRWVSSLGPPTPIRFYEGSRPRDELGDWVDEHAQVQLDPEWGPGWELAVQSFDDGATGVSLVVSHCIGDGGGVIRSMAAAVSGDMAQPAYPQPKSRSRLRAIRADLRQTVRDLPQVSRAVVAIAKQGWKQRDQLRAAKGSGAAPSGTDGSENVLVPAVWAFVDTADWDRRAAELGGNNHSMVAAFAARLAKNLGRFDESAGVVPLIVPIDDRSPGDTRANAVLLGNARLDPNGVTEDLTQVRAIMREALRQMHEEPDERYELLPLTPFVPKRAVTRTADLAVGFSELPVSCSNVGDAPDIIASADGTQAEYMMARGVDGQISRDVLEHRKGLLTVIVMRVIGKVAMPVIGYQPGAVNTKDQLRKHVQETLAEFGLTGVYM
jgi:hypothetical protein